MFHHPQNSLTNTNTASQKKIVVTDTEFRQEYDVSQNELVDVKDVRKILAKPARAEDIQQDQLGNCYFLSALGTILRHQPDFLSRVMSVNPQGKVEVTFHDAKDVSTSYTYIIDPSIVKKAQGNKHKHLGIDLLEKAYAIHRLTVEPTVYSSLQIQIKNKITAAGPNATPNTIIALLKDQIDEAVKIQMDVYHKILERREELTQKENLDIDEIFALNALKSCDGNEKQAIEVLLKSTITQKTSTYLDAIKTITDIMTEEKRDYVSALRAGFPDDVYRSLLAAETKKIFIYGDDDARYLLQEFLREILAEPLDKCSPRVQQTISRMFGDINSAEAQFFSQMIQSMHRTADWKQLQLAIFSLINKIDNKEVTDIHKELKLLFTTKLPWQDNSMTTAVLEKLLNFIDTNVPYKRGLGKNTVYQQRTYDEIWRHLHQGGYVAIETNSEEGLKKGLVMSHVYEVVNAYTRNGLNFVELRNPWSSQVRDYIYKEKETKEGAMTVISAVSRDQLTNLSFSFLRFNATSTPRQGQAQNPALPSPINITSSGYMELEISDVCKCCRAVYFASPKPALENTHTLSRSNGK